MSMALWATQGFQTVKYQTYVQDVVRPVLNLAFIIVFYLLGVEVLGAVAAYALSMVFGAVLALYYLKRVFPNLLNSRVKPKFESRALFEASGPMIVTSFTQQAHSWLALLVLGVFETMGAVGVYNVAFRTAALSTLVLFAFSGIFSPMVSSLYRRGLSRDLGYLYKDVSRWAFTGALAFFLLTALLAKDIMAVFGDEFVWGWPVIVVVAAAQLCSSSPRSGPPWFETSAVPPRGASEPCSKTRSRCCTSPDSGGAGAPYSVTCWGRSRASSTAASSTLSGNVTS
jgi:O-antigen/teichoic acid export membrane protein